MDYAGVTVGSCTDVTEDHLGQIGSLSINGTDVMTLQLGDFSGLTSLQTLEIFGNQNLETLPQGLFADLGSLQELDLDNNGLTSLPSDVFTGLGELTSLDLGGNSLAVTTLPSDVFAGLNNLASLRLDNNGLTTLPSDVFTGLGSLAGLDLASNGLTTLPSDVFAGLGSLAGLDLASNGLTSLPPGVISPELEARLFFLSLDNNPWASPLSVSDARVSEAAGAVSITVNLLENLGYDLTLSVSTSDVSATSGSDYVALSNVLLTIGSDASMGTVAVSILPDSLPEGDETFELLFTNVPVIYDEFTDELVREVRSTVTISDPVFVSFGSDSYRVEEGTSVSVSVILSASPDREVTLDILSLGQGGAAEGVDYILPFGSVTFGSEVTIATFTLTALVDDDDDDGESVVLSFVDPLPTGISRVEPSTTEVSILDDDDPVEPPVEPLVTVSFGAPVYEVAEGTSVEVRVVLDVDPERTVTIDLSVSGEGGADESDYSLSPTSLVFGPGVTSSLLTVNASADDVDDDGESVVLGFTDPLPSGISRLTPSTTEVSILDNDDPVEPPVEPLVTVTFGAPGYEIAEGSSVEVIVFLDVDPERTVTIDLSVFGEGGADESDYNLSPTSLLFGPGVTSSVVTVNALSDDDDDDGERLRLTLGVLPSGVTGGSDTTVLVSILDDDDPIVEVSFGSGSYDLSEDGSTTVSVELNVDPERTLLVTLGSTGAISSLSGIPADVTFVSGETLQEFVVSGVEDVDLLDAVVELTLSVPSEDTRALLGDPSATTLNVLDDDVPVLDVSFGSDVYTVEEGTSVSVTVILSGVPDREVTLGILSLGQGGAEEDVDYILPFGSVTFGSEATIATFTLTALADDDDDDGESVVLSFVDPLPTGISRVEPSTTEVSIVDDDDPVDHQLNLW